MAVAGEELWVASHSGSIQVRDMQLGTKMKDIKTVDGEG
jgi:hypothetical protein